MIKLENVRIQKGDKVILNDCHYTFEKGKSYALIGASGSGKSTLLNIIAGLEEVKEGYVYIEGEILKNQKTFYRYTLGYLFQNFALLDNQSINANLDLGLKFRKTREHKKQLKVDVLKSVGLNIDTNRMVNSLSGGEQQRVALARLILKNPQLILADEPTGSLDQQNGQTIIDLLLKQLDENKTIIVATHDLELAKQFDEIVHMDDLKN
ncbi:putative bacteriocin export ABC transporter [Staphylococcus hyicus]|uniref:Bacteriocin export ABC transporter n=1 Tax=Staphylococcus hyicus TaxID=1284 RepID=A0ACD5FJ32_STAHY|nr:putative bacteriocin export ABC transporter [Staphylococcus hyicus]MDP4464220.1 putative bacteriocin export ABC transporter [Staphylococcus hyicus]NJH99294.1 putative bacteriocin export ABC transporter [Staphylococcus hyicus]NJI30556.1 putative bacteriocin export ABC transporter [Staphylococcus hyicus]PTJ71091.1 bacteriocin ABC transporter ATP-binding protein [Staphylococcus hyicus]PTJ87139.1 bacteriocin ABC transporter ATP-binding protein [Staphylococcus hyicus]